MITALAGGVGAARLLRGMTQVVQPSEITVIVNTGDDDWIYGLYVSPDIDSVTYTLAGLHDEERGWGLAGETWTAMDAFAKLGGDAWFSLGDNDIATHLYRTERLAQEATLSEVTAELCGARGLSTRLIPMSDDRVRTRVTLARGSTVSFQEYFVRLRHSVPISAVEFEGADKAKPAPGVIDSLLQAEAIVICPSNPIVSLGPILAIRGVRKTLTARRDCVVAISPLVGGRALKGPADRMLTELGKRSSVEGISSLYKDVASVLVIDEQDASSAEQVESNGMRCVVTNTIMTTARDSATLSEVALSAVSATRGSGNRST